MAYELDIHYIDVGQGDCTLIVIRDEEQMQDNHSEFDNRIVQTIVIDCGTNGRESTVKNTKDQNYDPAEAAEPWHALLNKLQELKVEKIDKIIVTHFDKDHYNGIIFGFERYAAARAKNNPSTKDRLVIRLLTNVRIYDQGMVLFRSQPAFNRTPPAHFRIVNNPTQTADDDHKKSINEADDFLGNDENFTDNTGFDSIEHTQNIEKDRFKHFSGRDNYINYIRLTFENTLFRETERVMVGHPLQWHNGLGPFELEITQKSDDNGDGDEWVYIEEAFWGSTVSEGYFDTENLNYWGYTKSARKKTVYQTTRGSRVDIHQFEPRTVNVPGYNVMRLSPVHLLGQNLLEEFDSQEQPIQLTCIAANGFVWDTNNEPLRAFDKQGDDNSFSLGFVLKFGNLVHWFGGDLETKQENACIPTIKSIIGDTGTFVMKASHHGSELSSSEDFIKELKPVGVFISAGVRYGHPHTTTLHRFEQSKSIKHVFMTGTDNFEKMKLKGKLPKDFPVFTSIYHENSRFLIAGSPNHSGDIVLKCNSEESNNGIFTTNFINQNARLIVNEPVFSAAGISLYPIITLNSPNQIIKWGDNDSNKEDDSEVIEKRPRHNDDQVILELIADGSIAPTKVPRQDKGQIESGIATYRFKNNKSNDNE